MIASKLNPSESKCYFYLSMTKKMTYFHKNLTGALQAPFKIGNLQSGEYILPFTRQMKHFVAGAMANADFVYENESYITCLIHNFKNQDFYIRKFCVETFVIVCFWNFFISGKSSFGMKTNFLKLDFL